MFFSETSKALAKLINLQSKCANLRFCKSFHDKMNFKWQKNVHRPHKGYYWEREVCSFQMGV